MSHHQILKRITLRAKEIRKHNPKLEWKEAVKKASQELKNKKIMKKNVKKTHLKIHKKRHVGDSIASHVAEIKKKYLEQLGHEEVKKFMAKRKVDKNKISKKIREIKSKLKKII